MTLRNPYRAGSFYQASPDACRAEAQHLIEQAQIDEDLPQTLYGGLVPHAGWAYSGELSAKTIKALCKDQAPETFILFGADHVGTAHRGEVYDTGAWRTPLGDVPIDEDLAATIVNAADVMRSNPSAHTYEHSIEVQIPFLQVLAEDAKILPIAVPPSGIASKIGSIVGEAIRKSDKNVRVVGSTDLTHHGGHFASPGGRGAQGEKWSRQNDQRLLELVKETADDKVIPEASEHANACGAGAISATIAACKKLGATRGIVLEYTNSYQIIHAEQPDYPDDTTVGYASVVFA